ncbi:MAG: HD-GYP domain-containing protein [Defluviitaleaceae bacterium]|nr:HD-GYP domain-containing protein [Defluviitaleaceae bacterium]
MAKIGINDAYGGLVLGKPIYVKNQLDVDVLVARKGAQLDDILIERLKRIGITTLEIAENEEPHNTEYVPVVQLPEPPPAPPAPEPLYEDVAPVEAIIDNRLKEEAVSSVKQLFSFLSSGEKVNMTTAYQCVENIDGVVEDLLDVIAGDETGLVHISDLKRHDEYTYHHSLSVSVLSIAVGKELGFSKDMLFRLGRCAMLHDIGKNLIPLDILNKAGKLSDREFELIKTHPVIGAESLKKNKIGNTELWRAVMYHHEKVDGTGYPHKLTGPYIPLFSKIIAVTDVYDAITSYRSYRSPMLPSHAMGILCKDTGTHFEADIVKAFMAKLEPYPMNTIVQLSNGKLAKVVRAGKTKLNPVVKLWGSRIVLDLSASENKGIVIVEVLDEKHLPEGYRLRK